MKNRKIFFQLILIIISLIVSYFIVQDKRMSDNWMGPYLSAAHNLEWSGDFKISVNEVNYFKDLDVESQDSYRFSQSTGLSHYNHNPIGYAYLIRGATFLFPFVGHQMAIILLQCFVFFLINFLFLTLNSFNNKQKWLFLILFTVNPIILRFVTFNFYYFWQIIPSVLFGYLILCKKPNSAVLSIMILLLPFIILTRPTVVFALLIALFLLYKRTSLLFLTSSTIYIVLISFWLFQPIKKNIWHTIYTGLGAYTNSYNIKLNDNTTYKLYENKTGKKLNASIGGNYYNNDIINEYTEITKSETLKIFNKSPMLFIKNAIVNTLQGFSIGYINKAGDNINYIISFTGFLLACLLLYFKKYLWFLMIGLSIGSFTLYYPPIQAYMYGAYLLMILFLITLDFGNLNLKRNLAK
ncbi:hypothetical protein UMM65_03020 [Aureibaculum sp. 2210JD6-5]|uniref:hypothetical protein n=1 Tax=Aureibaculum sp. 2210JD6-5 TaxID=3103957 RepID=UPI002AADD2A0|nr:hypothetical protein [Aureibaculum sp. 2210JD6-5]MDY7394199.1 hypothetical protein [Aureibaculum sp. 2210JD6-5]